MAVNTNEDEQTPLYKAVLNNDIDLVKDLLNKGVDVNKKSKHGLVYVTPLLIAVDNGNVKIVDALIKANADVNLTGYHTKITPIIRAINSVNYKPKTEKNFLEILEILIKAGADLNIGDDKTNYTPLFFAANFNKIKPLEILLKAGAKVEQKMGRSRDTSVYEMAIAGKPFKPKINEFIINFVEMKHKEAGETAHVFREKIPGLPETTFSSEGKLPGSAANLIAEYSTGLVKQKREYPVLEINVNEGAAAGGHGGGRRKARKTRNGKKSKRGTRRP